MLIIILLIILAVIVVGPISLYNNIKTKQIKIAEAKSNIGVYLQQRHDEISAMYKIVQEYKLHELTTFREIVELRNLAMRGDLSFKEQTEIHNQIESKLPDVVASFEAYPELKSNENFLQLQEAIQNNEDNIAASRKAFNGYVNQYNTSIAMFPANIFANMFRFSKEDLYETPQEKMRNPLL